MDVMPTDVSSFRSPQYWNKFYSNPKLANFEWYEDFKRILPLFCRCLEERCSPFLGVAQTLGEENGCANLGSHTSKVDPENTVVINIGCGNSNTSNVLIDEGYDIVYNLDFSEQVLHDMRKTCRGNAHMVKVDVSSNEYLEFLCMINEKHEGKSKIIIDKAFLDAFISIGEGEDEKTIKRRAKSYIETTLEMMNFGDTFIIISLAQDYVVKEIIRNVLFKEIFVDIYPLESSDCNNRAKAAHLMQFIFTLYKNGKNIDRKQCKMDSIGMLDVEYFEAGQMVKMIKKTRTSFYLGPTIREYTPGRRLTFDIYPKDQDSSCFTAAVYDVVGSEHVTLSTCALIVPTGQEQLWMFSTLEGNEELAKNAGSKRVIIIWLKYDTVGLTRENIDNPLDSSTNETMKYIQNNLGEVLNKLSLEGSDGVTIMKIGDTSVIRTWKCVIPSNYAGRIIVRDIFDDSIPDCYKRQMIFSSSPQVIQSEVVYREEDGVEKFLFNYPSNEYHIAIALAMAFLPSQCGTIAILGSGTGVLTNILALFLKNRMHLVELDDAVIKVGYEHFGLETLDVVRMDAVVMDTVTSNVAQEKNLHIHSDALEYLEACIDCDAVVLDINNGQNGSVGNAHHGATLWQVTLEKGTLMSPNPRFLERDALENVSRMLEKSCGLFIVNLLTRSKTARKRILNMLREVFQWISAIKTPNDLNEVIVCSNSPISSALEMYTRHANALKENHSLLSDLDMWISGFSIEHPDVEL